MEYLLINQSKLFIQGPVAAVRKEAFAQQIFSGTLSMQLLNTSDFRQAGLYELRKYFAQLRNTDRHIGTPLGLVFLVFFYLMLFFPCPIKLLQSHLDRVQKCPDGILVVGSTEIVHLTLKYKSCFWYLAELIGNRLTLLM